WLHGIMLVAGLALGFVTVGPILTLVGLGGSYVGGWAGVQLAQALGLSEDWQKVFGFGGSVLGGWGAMKLAEGALGEVNQQCKCDLGLEPIDMGSGRVVDSKRDIALPGAFSFLWKRHYSSSQNLKKSTLGHGGWTHSYDQWVVHEPGRTILHGEEGRDAY